MLPNLLRPNQLYPYQVKHIVQYARAMTLCIAAVCDHGRSIVGLADTRISTGLSSSEGHHKIFPLHRDWLCLYAGHGGPSQDAIHFLTGAMGDTGPISRDEVRERTFSAFEKYPCRRGQSRQLLVGGFEAGHPRIFTVLDRYKKPPKDEIFDATGFATIGAGYYAAHVVLDFFDQRRDTPLNTALYSCCAAKFFAERASDVGEVTYGYVQHAGEHEYYPPGVLAPLRTIWATEGQLPFPARAQQYLETLT